MIVVVVDRAETVFSASGTIGVASFPAAVEIAVMMLAWNAVRAAR